MKDDILLNYFFFILTKYVDILIINVLKSFGLVNYFSFCKYCQNFLMTYSFYMLLLVYLDPGRPLKNVKINLMSDVSIIFDHRC